MEKYLANTLLNFSNGFISSDDFYGETSSRGLTEKTVTNAFEIINATTFQAIGFFPDSSESGFDRQVEN
jgi:hypothetical protein